MDERCRSCSCTTRWSGSDKSSRRSSSKDRISTAGGMTTQEQMRWAGDEVADAAQAQPGQSAPRPTQQAAQSPV
eukprot:2344200-Prorocentrum_lima.AAC.1